MAEGLQRDEQQKRANHYEQYNGSQCPAWSLKTHDSAWSIQNHRISEFSKNLFIGLERGIREKTEALVPDIPKRVKRL